MKTRQHIFTFLSLLLLFQLQAQPVLTNGDFEAWVTHPTPVFWQEPEAWSTSNRFTGDMGCGGGPGIYIDTQRISGKYAVRILSLEFGFAAQAYAGFIVSGDQLQVNANGEFELEKAGIPYSGKPSSLQGYYKYTSWDTLDSALVMICLTTYDPILKKRDTIALGKMFLSQVNSFQQFQLPLTYTGLSIAPDTAVVFFASSNPANPLKGGDLRLDNLAFSDPALLNESLASSISLFPNPATDEIFLRSAPGKEIRFTKIEVWNTMGQVVYLMENTKGILNPSIKINHWSPSLYIVNGHTTSGEEVSLRMLKI